MEPRAFEPAFFAPAALVPPLVGVDPVEPPVGADEVIGGVVTVGADVGVEVVVDVDPADRLAQAGDGVDERAAGR